jgi:hypothetical protein
MARSFLDDLKACTVAAQRGSGLSAATDRSAEAAPTLIAVFGSSNGLSPRCSQAYSGTEQFGLSNVRRLTLLRTVQSGPPADRQKAMWTVIAHSQKDLLFSGWPHHHG